ncbi:MAG: diguanylate cyclase [Hydrogenophilales bacterium]|nr:diguanylate cyclase [Hydrogenophilales bacterium]
MSLSTISPEELPAILSQLDQAIYNHTQWFDAISRTLICQHQANEDDLSSDAHRKCLLGQWYYGSSPAEIRSHPGFVALGEEHEHMHQQAAHLLNLARAGMRITAPDYDNFANSLQRVRLQILTLSRELEDLQRSADPLTGASSRAYMLPKLREQQELIKRGVHRCCLAMMDLDHFKVINDTHGHIAGDLVLATTVRYIIEHLRPYDQIYRFGGEEFLICMLNTNLNAGQEMMERLREGIAELPIDIGNGKPILITASFGLSSLESGISVEESIDRADKAMYAAKAAGRNRVCLWGSPMDQNQVN